MLEEFIEANGLSAKIIKFEKEVASAKQASLALKVELSDIAKTIVLINPKTKIGVLAVVLGDSTVDLEKLSAAAKEGDLEPANPKQVIDITGYESGGVPPVSIYGVKTIIDKKVMEKETVYAGGGDEFSMLKISPKEIEEHAFEAQIKDISAELI